MDLLKLTDGLVDPSMTWSFVLYAGPDGFGSDPIGSSSTFGDPDGVLEFGGPALRPDTTYTVCELEVPAGYASIWQLDTDGDGVGDTGLVPYNPNADDDPPEDLGNRCVDFGANTNIPLLSGTTLHFVVDNQYPGGSPRTPGYWKNWNMCTGGNQQYTATQNAGYDGEPSDYPIAYQMRATAGFWLLEDVLAPAIGGGIVWDDILNDDEFEFTIDACAVAVDILDKREIGDPDIVGDGKKQASDPLHNLATHLMAAQLNFASGACTTQEVRDAAMAAEQLLDKYNFDGTGHDSLKKKDPDAALANSLAEYLDYYNNGNVCGDGND
jgi:hypothetical protein